MSTSAGPNKMKNKTERKIIKYLSLLTWRSNTNVLDRLKCTEALSFALNFSELFKETKGQEKENGDNSNSTRLRRKQ